MARAHAKGLSLDVILPPGVAALLPNLQQLLLEDCAFTPAARTTVLDAACGRLRYLEIKGLAVHPTQAGGAAASQPAPSLQQLATAQLRQLAKIPSLGSIKLTDSSCPTLFLMALGTQLTRLELHESYRQCEPGTQTPTAEWKATLQHVARCTRLRDLHVPCVTAEELGLVAPALQELRALWLNDAQPQASDGDAMVEVLLSLPHLTTLMWAACPWDTMQRSFVDRPCAWERLHVDAVTPELLARLPLHSLKHPMECAVLLVAEHTRLHDVRAAVANVTRRCPPGMRWGNSGHDWGTPALMFDSAADVPGVLRALQPLLAPLASVHVMGVAWDAGRVQALGEVLARGTRLVLSHGHMPWQAFEQVARSVPWLQSLQLQEQEVLPEDVVAYVRLARRLKGEEGGGLAVRLGEVVVARLLCPEGVCEVEHKRAWERAEREVHEEEGRVVLRVKW